VSVYEELSFGAKASECGKSVKYNPAFAAGKEWDKV